MNHRRALTVLELLVVVAVLAVAVAFLVYAMTTGRAEACKKRCQSNLVQLAKGMETYLNPYGDEEWFPWPVGRAGCGGTTSADAADFGGAEWLAMLYWTKIIPDPDVYICPSSGDWNENGRNLGQRGCSGPGFQPGPDGKLKPDAVSYAGLGDMSVSVYERLRKRRPGVVPKSALNNNYRFPPSEPMACDDTEGPIHHGTTTNGGMNVLLFDCHVEYWTQERVDLEHGVGTGELVILRN